MNAFVPLEPPPPNSLRTFFSILSPPKTYERKTRYPPPLRFEMLSLLLKRVTLPPSLAALLVSSDFGQFFFDAINERLFPHYVRGLVPSSLETIVPALRGLFLPGLLRIDEIQAFFLKTVSTIAAI